MRKKLVMHIVSLIAALGASTAIAGPATPSLAFVQQATGGAGGSSAALMDTASIFKPSMDVLTSAKSMDTSDLVGNLSLVYQSGDFNTASIEQTGSRNVGVIQQIGYMNSASITQAGVGHQAFVRQEGRNNVAIIRQR
ncbi:hypothetical protein [uncultured Agrobacterium sp.]|uniref:hypothetical protein n=1 Tax=uncultured Agrobacterium sp. TaxID=157277 RepID=UPI0025E14695|nr:hypothetical protein [uncultured Agrobacterium sp.]